MTVKDLSTMPTQQMLDELIAKLQNIRFSDAAKQEVFRKDIQTIYMVVLLALKE